MAEDKITGLSLINKALPSEILEKVFKQLDDKGLHPAKLTCKHWKQSIDHIKSYFAPSNYEGKPQECSTTHQGG